MKNKKYILSFLLFILLFGITYFYIFRKYDFNLLINTLKSCNILYIILGLISMIMYPVFEAIFIKRFFKYLDCDVSFYQALGYTFTEIYFSGITPSSTGGQPVQMLEMKKDNITYSKSTTVVIFNTIMYKMTLIFLLVLSLIFFSKDIFSKFSLFKWLVIGGSLFNILFILFLISLLYSNKVINFVKKCFNYIVRHIKIIKNKDKLIEMFDKTINEYREASLVIKGNYKMVIESFVILLLQRISILIISYFVYRSFGFNEFNIFLIIAFQVFITIASDFVPTPGGVMVAEGIMISINKYLYGNINDVSAMLLQRSISFYFLIIISFIFYLIFHYDKKRRL